MKRVRAKACARARKLALYSRRAYTESVSQARLETLSV